MPDVRSRPSVPTTHVNEKEHRRMLADQANAGIPVLRDFTPSLLFGGASTGITYSRRLGRSVTMASVVHILWIEIILTSKGSSAGAATLSGLLETNNSGAVAISADVSIENAAGAISDLKAVILDAGNTISLLHTNGGTTGLGAAVDDADFTNTSILRAHIAYRVV